MTPTVSILLSTFNGEEYLNELLDSLVSQTYSNYEIHIRDDQSTDQTPQIIQNYVDKFPHLLMVLDDKKGNLGVHQSFRELLVSASSDYYLFCDQDDIWDDNKVEAMVDAAQNSRVADSKPFLISTNYRIVDKKNTVVCASTYDTYKLQSKELDRGLFQGFVPGCTMMFNKKLKEIFLNYQNTVGLHDIKLLNLCYLFGKIELYRPQTMSYRVHENNTVGLHQKQSTKVLLKDLFKYSFRSKNYRNLLLSDYFTMQVILSKETDSELLDQKEYFDEKTINRLSIFKRKRWYLRHFKPFHRSNLEGLIRILLI